MSDGSRHYPMLLMATHLRVEHGWSWRKLRKFFTGRSNDFWQMVRWTVERMEDADE